MKRSRTRGKAQAEPIQVTASEFKNTWHENLDQVVQGRREVVVTRYGRPIAKLVPYEGSETVGGLFGCLAGSVTIHGDLVAPLGESWEADA